MKESDRYLKLVTWSEEDQCYVGSIPGWIDNCCHGDDEEKVYHELKGILEEWIKIYKKEKRPLPPETMKREYSGKFQLRLGRQLHKLIAIKALQAETSLNNFCVKKLKEVIAES